MALDMKAAAAAASEADGQEQNEIPAEILAVIAAAATAFLGTNFRILSAQMQQSPHERVSKWTRQGRAFVQASHNVRSKR